jgi:DNA-binding NtrC family response regulator
MPGMNGIELLREINNLKSEIYVIVMTAYGSIETAVEVMKYGAFDYIGKPFKIEELIFKLKRIEEIESIKSQNINLKEIIESSQNTSKFIGKSEAVNNIHKMIDTVANASASVLITGETGTGKELIANIIHNNSSRKNKVLIKVSCAILSRDVFESELFGHEKGSFTGAVKDRIGRFEQADGGTIYLDDIDDIPIDLQVKLLRVLQEREFERVGGNETIKVDFRCIASSKANLLKLVKEGKFREDLYYRLNVFPINIPPLRERKEDIPGLIQFYLNYFSPVKAIILEENLMKLLTNYDWEGNVRELKNIVERICLHTHSCNFDLSRLPLEISQNSINKTEVDYSNKSLDELVSDYETSLIKKALNLSNGNKAKAAEILKIPATTLKSKIDKYLI